MRIKRLFFAACEVSWSSVVAFSAATAWLFAAILVSHPAKIFEFSLTPVADVFFSGHALVFIPFLLFVDILIGLIMLKDHRMTSAFGRRFSQMVLLLTVLIYPMFAYFVPKFGGSFYEENKILMFTMTCGVLVIVRALSYYRVKDMDPLDSRPRTGAGFEHVRSSK